MPGGVIARRKDHYPVSSHLGQYLYHYHRYADIPVVYDNLAHFGESFPYENPAGRETLWQTVVYPPETRAELYAKTGGFTLKRVLSVSEGGRDTPPMPMMMVAKMAPQADAVPFMAGEQDIRATVNMTWEIEPAGK